MILAQSKFEKLFENDPYNSIVFNTLKGIEVYVVGGYIRDTILKRKVIDRDYVVEGNSKEKAREIANQVNGTLVKIGKRNLYRIFMKNGMTMDFTSINKDIEKDLSDRDFTINALAWSPKNGLLDLYGGVKDIRKGQICVIRNENLIDDPIRILRAFRISGELDFEINNVTAEILRKLSYKIQDAKTERITSEFFKILNLYDTFVIIQKMIECNILKYIILISNRKLADILQLIYEINQIIYQKPFKNLLKLKSTLSQGLSNLGFLRLALFLKDNPLNNLNLSSNILKRLRKIEKASKIINMEKGNKTELLYCAYREAGYAATDFLIINKMMNNIPDLKRFQKIDKKALLSFQEINHILKDERGIVIGRAIEFIKKAEFCKEIKRKRDATELLEKNSEILTI